MFYLANVPIPHISTESFFYPYYPPPNSNWKVALGNGNWKESAATVILVVPEIAAWSILVQKSEDILISKPSKIN